jgi:hypothetical protein
VEVQVYVILPDDRNLRQGIPNCRAGMSRGAPVVLECQLNFTISLKAIEIKHQITISIKSLYDHQLAIPTDDKLTHSAWRFNFEFQLAAEVGHGLDCRRPARCLCGARFCDSRITNRTIAKNGLARI